MCSEDMIAIGLIFLGGLLVSGAHFRNDVEVRPKFECFGEGIDHQLATLETDLHGLVNDPAQRDQIIFLGDLGGILLGLLQPLSRPINCVRFGEATLNRPVMLIDFLHELRIHFVFFPQ